jgi:hypothetical protein
MKWYKVYNNKTDGGNLRIKYLHFQNDTLFHGSRLIIFIVIVNLFLSWGAQVDYGVSQKTKLICSIDWFRIIRLYHILEMETQCIFKHCHYS